MLILSLIIGCGDKADVEETTVSTAEVTEESDIQAKSDSTTETEVKVSNTKNNSIVNISSTKSDEDVPVDNHTKEVISAE